MNYNSCDIIQLTFHVQKWCKACVLLDGLNRGLPKLGIGRSRVAIGCKEENESHGRKSIESKQCGSLDF
jgi:cytoplasmic tRNA 2-thiolation protein 1